MSVQLGQSQTPPPRSPSPNFRVEMSMLFSRSAGGIAFAVPAGSSVESARAGGRHEPGPGGAGGGESRSLTFGEPPLKFGEFAEAWLAERIKLMKAGLVSGNSIRRVESVLAAHLLPFFAAYPLDEIDRSRCEGFRAALFQSQTLAERSINSITGLLGVMLRRAIQDGLMAGPDPMRGMRPLAERKRRVECYTPEETRALLAATDPRYRAMVALAALAGLRRGEVLALGRDDVDLDAGVIHVQRSLQVKNRLLTDAQRLGPPKTATSIREVPIRSTLAPILTEHDAEIWRPNRFNLFFSGTQREPFADANKLRSVGYWPAMKQAGLPRLAFHELRVGFITHCALAGVPLPVIARWVGHATVRVTDYYVHATRNTERDALALLSCFDEAGR